MVFCLGIVEFTFSQEYPDLLSIGVAAIVEVRGKMTQLAFAQSLNIAKSTLIRYENGDRQSKN